MAMVRSHHRQGWGPWSIIMSKGLWQIAIYRGWFCMSDANSSFGGWLKTLHLTSMAMVWSYYRRGCWPCIAYIGSYNVAWKSYSISLHIIIALSSISRRITSYWQYKIHSVECVSEIKASPSIIVVGLWNSPTTICLVSSKITSVAVLTISRLWCDAWFRNCGINFVRHWNALGACFKVVNLLSSLFHFCSKIPKWDRVHGVCFRAVIHHH